MHLGARGGRKRTVCCRGFKFRVVEGRMDGFGVIHRGKKKVKKREGKGERPSKRDWGSATSTATRTGTGTGTGSGHELAGGPRATILGHCSGAVVRCGAW